MTAADLVFSALVGKDAGKIKAESSDNGTARSRISAGIKCTNSRSLLTSVPSMVRHVPERLESHCFNVCEIFDPNAV